MTLRDLQTGESAVITTVGGSGALRQHFLDMGIYFFLLLYLPYTSSQLFVLQNIL